MCTTSLCYSFKTKFISTMYRNYDCSDYSPKDPPKSKSAAKSASQNLGISFSATAGFYHSGKFEDHFQAFRVTIIL